MARGALSARRSRAKGRWLVAARVLWLAVVLVELAIFAAAVPPYWSQLSTVCADPSGAECNWPQLLPAEVEMLEGWGLTIDAYAVYTLAIHVAASLVYFAVGGLIFWRKHDDWYGLFVSLFLITFGAGGVSAVFDSAFLWAYPEAALVTTIFILQFPALGLFLVTFPDGRFVPRWGWIVALLWVMQLLLWERLDGGPPLIFAAELLLVYGSTLAVMVYRYLRVSDVAQRQQTKWLVFGLALGVSTFALLGLLALSFPGFGEPGSAFGILEGTHVVLLFTPIPLAVGVAILRYRLWDIDLIINRALVYGALTAAVVGVYVLLVGYLGALFQTRDNLLVSLAATGLVAVLFHPLRERLQRGVDRLTYGERDDPYAAISRLGKRLEAALEPEAVLPTIVQTVREALRLPYAAVALGTEDDLVSESGKRVADPLRLPLLYRGEPVGELLLAPRSGEEGFSPADRHLLEGLARQAGVAAHAVRLTNDLKSSRERLVTAREEERRRLRRDLHDGLGPTLGSLPLKLDVADDLVVEDPAAARELLRGLKIQAQSAVVDIRRLVYDLRPPALDDLGLLGALRELAAQHGTGGLDVAAELPEELPPLPAAVEVACLRIAQEALTNVARHSGANACVVRLDVGPKALRLEVSDDGRGLGAGNGSGVGLHSMRERAEELGGSCVVDQRSGGGTRVRALLPLTQADREKR